MHSLFSPTENVHYFHSQLNASVTEALSLCRVNFRIRVMVKVIDMARIKVRVRVRNKD